MPLIRLAKATDLPQIVTIYNQAVLMEATADTFPVTVKSKQDWFVEHSADRYPIYVLEEPNNQVVAWISLSAYRKGRRALACTAEISYFIEKQHRGKGLAGKMLAFVMKECKKLAIDNLFGIIMEDNIASIKFLKKNGFEKWAYLPNVANFNGRTCGQVYLGIHLSKKITL